MGDLLANFKLSDGDYGGIAGWSDDGADITNKVAAYSSNSYGLYHMAGNVAEWVAEIARGSQSSDSVHAVRVACYT